MLVMMLRVRSRLPNFPVELRAELLAPVEDAVQGVPLDTHVCQCRRPVHQRHHLACIHGDGALAIHVVGPSTVGPVAYGIKFLGQFILTVVRWEPRPLLVHRTSSHTRWLRRRIRRSRMQCCSLYMLPGRMR